MTLAMSSNVVINIYRNPLEPEEDPPTWCCMPQVSGMAVSVCLIICFELGTLAAVNVLPDLDRLDILQICTHFRVCPYVRFDKNSELPARFDPDMHFYVAVFSAGTAVELLINMVAAIALYMKVYYIFVPENVFEEFLRALLPD